MPVREALGATLAHSVRSGDVSLKKGRVLTANDIAALTKSGITTVHAARLEADDVAENDAAGLLAAALAGPGARAEPPFTGRANLYAETAGLITFDTASIAALNAVDEGITVATLTPFEPVEKGQMVATVKIIPFAVPRAALDRALALTGTGALSVRPFTLQTADLILTDLPGTKPALLAKAERVIRERLSKLGIDLASVRRCAHETDAIAAFLATPGKQPDMTLILGASATGDRRDVVPAGIVEAGGTLTHFGMPVDPGNLLLLAERHGRPVVGLPGCARSPRLNGADWVLQRLAAGLDVTPGDIQAMGVGGLLKEIPSRPQPRRKETEMPETPRTAAIILGAGRSARMGSTNKLTEMIGTKPMLAHVVDAALSSRADEIVLVTGHERERVLASLGGRPLTEIHNPDYAHGLGTSVAAGIKEAATLDPPVDAAIVLLGDMPLVGADLIDALIAAHDREEDCYICVPTVAGKRGNPVLWDATFFPDLEKLTGDTGAKHLIADHADLVCEVPVTGEAPLIDVDTPEALAERRR